MTETKHYTWEEKIDSLVKLAKAAGRYINSRDEQGTDYNIEAMFSLRDAYEEFCEWRHDEPYVVDEIKMLLITDPEDYIDAATDTRLIVNRTLARPLVMAIFPEHHTLSLEECNAALGRLRLRAGIQPAQLPNLVLSETPME